MKENLITIASAFGILLGLIATVFGAIAAMAYLVEKPACSSYGKLTGYETYFTLGTGCLVKYRNEWVALEVATKKKSDITIKE